MQSQRTGIRRTEIQRTETQRSEVEQLLPEAFCSAMRELLGDEYEEYLDSFQQKSCVGIRLNRQKISVSEFLERRPFPVTPVPWTENGFYVESDERVSRHPWYAAGVYYIQEPSAMLPAARLPVEPGDRVLDLCAAPGGKATELGSRLKGQGLLVANDISASRARGLLKNLELFGVGNLFVCSERPETLAERYMEYFDKILVDAPCSGEGMFRRDPSMIKSWLQRGPSWYCQVQRQILSEAWKMLCPGGMLLYSTCTFSVMENEDVIRWFLENYPDMELCSMPVCEGFAPGICREHESHPELQRCVRLFPHRIRGEGHFAALLKKKTGSEQSLEIASGFVPEDRHSGKQMWNSAETDSHGKQIRRNPDENRQKKQTSKISEWDSLDRQMRNNPEKNLQEKPMWNSLEKDLQGKPRQNRPEKNLQKKRIRKNQDGEGARASQAGAESALRKASWQEFVEYLLKDEMEQDRGWNGLRTMQIGDYLHGIPEGISIPKGLRFLRTGMLLGSFQKSRFTPSQALAMYLKPEAVKHALCLPEGDLRVSRYLKGETLELSEEELSGLESGWVLVCVDQYSLGWGKLAGGTLRNKYEPGWRMAT